MSVSHPVFLAIVGGMLFAGVVAIPSGVLAIRYGLARGIKIIGAMLLPLVALWAGVGLLRMNPIEGEYRLGIVFILLGVIGPCAAVYDLRRVLDHRRKARTEGERGATLA
ncbi:hypothetical protein [Micromonospora sp. NPDC047187]|uniref:hypothetical protein n=1 Tax=Micromonospora sp. NPDC047187 TaxID=3155262 RepID=UPI0033E74144